MLPLVLSPLSIVTVSAAKVRRLYDIANVLTSLDLIKKVHVREERGRKPAFKWLGPVEFDHSANAGKSYRRAVRPVAADVFVITAALLTR